MTADMTVDVFRARSLDGVPHGFLGRRGGVSTGSYASLNVGLGSPDLPEAIAANRRRAVEAVASGRYLDDGDVIREGLRLLGEQAAEEPS